MKDQDAAQINEAVGVILMAHELLVEEHEQLMINGVEVTKYLDMVKRSADKIADVMRAQEVLE